MIAGEVSGDVHGAGLIRCLARKNDNLDFSWMDVIKLKKSKVGLN